MRASVQFLDHPEFVPNLTPADCIRAGIFGGVYFNPEGGKPGILRRRVDVTHREFPPEWFSGVPRSMYASRRYTAAVNRYGVVAGSDQAAWERQGWMHQQDPRGWFQWYCRFYTGRRTADDARQIRRWRGVAGPRGRWRRFLINRVGDVSRLRDETVSPVVRQTLLHWAYELQRGDFGAR
jgi:hypothetical protein